MFPPLQERPRLVGLGFLLFVSACSSVSEEQPIQPAPGGNSSGQAGGSSVTGGSSANTAGSSGAPAVAGAGSGGAAAGAANTDAGSGGNGGVPPGGSGTGGASGGAGAGGTVEPGDTLPARPLDFQAAATSHTHTVNGHGAGVHGGVPHLMSKLIVQLDGGLYTFGFKRGFHVLGVNLPVCPIHYMTREHNGDCRLEVFDGVDRVDDFAVTKEESVTGQVIASLKSLQGTYPEEDWAYFLNPDGSVRWSDVGFTGASHRAQSATRFAVAMRVWRAVARAGPRDNNCGFGVAKGDYDPANLPYDVNCPLEKISAWLDETPKTPLDRFFGFVGKTDDQYGDILFSMEHLKLVGKPVNVTTAKAPYDGTHRFYADAGHEGFDGPEYYDALNIAWGVPPENASWALTH